MNRRDRRAARRAGITEDAITYAATERCPDCTSDAYVDVVHGVAVLTLVHDPTCPLHRRHRTRTP